MKVTVVSDIPSAGGWYPILHMQRLMAELLSANVHDISGDSIGRVRMFLNRSLPRQSSDDDHIGVFLVCSAHGAQKAISAARSLGGFSRSVLWIIESFWTEAAAYERRHIDRHFDLVAFTQGYDADVYGKLFGRRAICLEWGSDVLNLGGAGAKREIDLLRLGRQPPSWENDMETARASTARRIRFAGRPPPDAKEVSTLMRDHYGHAKFVLAHSNLAAPAPYTHPTKAYITARWTDALASGATVAGTPPENDLALLDWPDAILPVPYDDREAGLDRIASAVAGWTPRVAERNYLGALRKLDWRWRFRKLASALEVSDARLDQSLRELEARIQLLTLTPSRASLLP